MNGNNRIIIEQGLKEFSRLNFSGHEDSELFELYSLSLITKKLKLSFQDLEDSVVDGANDGGIDSFVILIDDMFIPDLETAEQHQYNNKTVCKFIICQSKQENSFKESPVEKLIVSIPLVFSLSGNNENLDDRFNPLVLTKAEIARKAYEKTILSGGKIEVEYYYATLAEDANSLSSSYKSKVNQLLDTSKKLFQNDASFHNFSCEELLQMIRLPITNEMTLQFKEAPLSPSYGENDNMGYIGLVKLSAYKDFITGSDGKILDGLFESNIRHFQGDVAVNKGISKTLSEISDRDFWWLNNGVTIIADSSNSLGSKLKLTNVQIVNGLQTSYCIFNDYKKLENDERTLLVKVIVNTNKNIVDDIIESTNFQNKVTPGTLRATDDIQKDIEKYFLAENYYYDRRKNYYSNLGKPSSRIFDMRSTAQAITAILRKEPHLARTSPSGLLTSPTVYKSIFKKDNNYKAYLNCRIVLAQVDACIKNLKNAEDTALLKYFKMHLCLICVMLITKNVYYAECDIYKMKLPATNFEKVFSKSKDMLKEAIEKYKIKDKSVNLMNIAKQKAFTDFLIKHIAGNKTELIK